MSRTLIYTPSLTGRFILQGTPTGPWDALYLSVDPLTGLVTTYTASGVTTEDAIDSDVFYRITPTWLMASGCKGPIVIDAAEVTRKVVALLPLIQQVVDGHEVKWNGQQYAASLSPSAEDAYQTVGLTLERGGLAVEGALVFYAADWITTTTVRDVGLSQEAAPGEIFRAARDLLVEAEAEGVWIADGLPGLERALRDSIADMAE